MRLEEYSRENKNFTITRGQRVIDSTTHNPWIIGGRFVGLNKSGNPEVYFRLTEDILQYPRIRTVSLSSLLNNYEMPEDGKEG